MMEMNLTISTIIHDYCNASNTTDNDGPCECGQKVNACGICDLYDFIIYGVLGSLIGLFGIVGNTISIIVLSRPKMKSSINYLLVMLAISDNTLIIISILILGLIKINKYTGLLFLYKFIVYPKISKLLYPLICMAQMTTVYLTLAVSMERYIAVYYPLKVRSFCTYGRARAAVLIMVVLALLYNIPKFWEYEAREEIHWKYNVTVYCMFPTELKNNDYYNIVYIHWMHSIVYVPFIYTLPFVVLLILNTAIYRQVRRANRDLQKLSRRQRNEINLTRMLMCVVMVFLICNIMSSVNFIIYMIFGDNFKRMFLKLFCMSWQRRFERNSMAFQRSSMLTISTTTSIELSQ
ncbi:PREDICTED: FMRFamide receptor-like isoform X2 [Dinoponera quadriceps]|uniref:FMRFamide receptor-like isoform X2 n=1 Tax=Dinoponera quadriceps TaxID=609295 RepID=A0A6P3XN76_DINQU|nr:PREDICTED: FMRFamide receptor-like isoform X2 [Dinoponera quadriceps]